MTASVRLPRVSEDILFFTPISAIPSKTQIAPPRGSWTQQGTRRCCPGCRDPAGRGPRPFHHGAAEEGGRLPIGIAQRHQERCPDADRPDHEQRHDHNPHQPSGGRRRKAGQSVDDRQHDVRQYGHSKKPHVCTADRSQESGAFSNEHADDDAQAQGDQGERGQGECLPAGSSDQVSLSDHRYRPLLRSLGWACLKHRIRSTPIPSIAASLNGLVVSRNLIPPLENGTSGIGYVGARVVLALEVDHALQRIKGHDRDELYLVAKVSPERLETTESRDLLGLECRGLPHDAVASGRRRRSRE